MGSTSHDITAAVATAFSAAAEYGVFTALSVWPCQADIALATVAAAPAIAADYADNVVSYPFFYWPV